ncbi:MAG: GDSL-type esterase/lipase family protein [Phycisphaeraceae bacterium]
MKLTPDQIAPFITGADHGQIIDGAWHAQRIPAPMNELHESAEGLRARAACHAGVRLRFTTDARRLRLTLRFGAEARPFYRGTLLVDGDEARPFGPADKQTPWSGTVFEQNAAAAHEFDLWLPHMAQADIVALEADDATRLEPASPLPLRWIALGDSITQGMTASLPHLAVTARCALALNAALHNWAVGGAKLEAELADTLPDVEAGLISIAYGTNDFNQSRPVESYRDNTARLLEAATAQWPGRPLVLITPLTWAQRTEPNSVGHTLDDYRAAAASVAENFEHVHLVAGDKLMDDDPALFVDNVHPNDTGFAQYADRLLPELRAVLAPSPSGRGLG